MLWNLEATYRQTITTYRVKYSDISLPSKRDAAEEASDGEIREHIQEWMIQQIDSNQIAEVYNFEFNIDHVLFKIKVITLDA